MRWIAVLLVLLPLQESSPVPDLLKKIDGRDPVETFRAIDALADLGPDRRAEIEKGAAALPEFYREALLAELKTPVLTPRVTLPGDKLIPKHHLREWARQTGVAFRNSENDGVPGEETELAFDSLHGLDALARIFAASGYFTRQESRLGDYGIYHRPAMTGAFGHRSAAVILYEGLMRRRVDFSGSAPWRLEMSFETILGPGARPVRWDRIRVFEAVAQDGTKLEPAGPPAPSMFAESIPPDRWDPKLRLDFVAPEKFDRIARLKFSARGLVALKEKTLEFPVRAGRSETRDGIDLRLGLLRSKGRENELRLEIRSKDPSIQRLLPSVFHIELIYKDVKGDSLLWDSHEIEGGASCVVYWDYDYRQFKKGPCTCGGCGCSCFTMTDEEIDAVVPRGYPDAIRLHLP
ncbi:MAG TPA: hypothetical protein VFC86_10695, partial [Planctomycetota bacterium]|nr:hypothetical protein [Planctomycetota bacterium]